MNNGRYTVVILLTDQSDLIAPSSFHSGGNL